MPTRALRVSMVSVAVVLAAGCGSSAAKTAAPPTPPKLSLTRSGGTNGAADAVAPGPIDIRPPSYVLDGTLPDLGTQAPVYRWTAHTTSVDDATALAHAFGLDATASATADGFQATDGRATLTVTTSGGTTQVSYFLGGPIASGGSSGSGAAVGAPPVPTADGPAVEVPPNVPTPGGPGTTVEIPPPLTAPVDVPSASDATTIARALLDRAGVLTGQQWASDVADSGGIAISCVVGEKCTDTPGAVTARDVTFTLLIGDAQVSGITWTVTVGEHGQVESVSGEWATAVSLGNYDLRTTGAAFTALQHGQADFGGVEPVIGGDVPVAAQGAPDSVPDTVSGTGTLPGADGGSRPPTIRVTGASLGIARWDAVDGGRNVVDLVPVYVFHTVDGTQDLSSVEVLALDPSTITFATPIIPPTPVPEPGRVTPEPAPVPSPLSEPVAPG